MKLEHLALLALGAFLLLKNKDGAQQTAAAEGDLVAAPPAAQQPADIFLSNVPQSYYDWTARTGIDHLTFTWNDLVSLPSGWYLGSPGTQNYYGGDVAPTDPLGLAGGHDVSFGSYARVERFLDADLKTPLSITYNW